MTNVAIIAIGRNEGERLRLCLGSVVGQGMAVVYVDSGSTDGSRDVARLLGADVVELDLSTPFSAARARNAGYERAMQLMPALKYVQFVDGDCEIAPTWIDAARKVLEERNDVAVVCGRRRERFPEASIYNRLADLEWDRPPGEVESCGGDAMIRVDAFGQVNGFDPSIAAGEEPELCMRLRGKGWRIVRIAEEMTLHDSGMTRFSQWWRRQVRSGYGAIDVATRFKHPSFARQVQSARLWTLWWVVAVCLTWIFLSLLLVRPYPWQPLVLVAILPLLKALSLVTQTRKRLGTRDAYAYGCLTMLAKWAQLYGHFRYTRDRAAGRNTRLIEYKSAPCATTPTSPPTSAATRVGHS